MKRFHVHVTVKDLGESVGFYSKVFGIEPTVLKPDYAKWMVDDPRINFAISACGAGRRTGVNHLGLQVDSDDELKGMRSQLAAADAALAEQTAVSCCYAKSDKYWVTDPQGIAWETWHNLGSVPVYGPDRQATRTTDALPDRCCGSAPDAINAGVSDKTSSRCCT
jgi:hypothetical protein